MAKRKLSPEQEQSICKRYLAGETSTAIARDFELNPETILNILKRGGVTIRSRRKTDKAKDLEIVRRYKAGEGTIRLGNAFGLNRQTVSNILQRNGVILRQQREINVDEAKEICRRYLKGENTRELAEAFEVSDVTITNILTRNKVPRRTISESQGGFSAAEEKKICKRYEKGESTVEIGDSYGCGPNTIWRVLKRNNVSIRSFVEALGGLTPEEEAEVCSRYQEGETGRELSKAFGISDTGIFNILRRNRVEAREGSALGDSVQDAIDGTGRHARDRECCFYLYELARFSETHCKPGIATVVEDRTDEEYGKEVICIEYDLRAKALFLEKAVLEATRHKAQLPSDLAGWNGATEVRAMPASELEPLVLELAVEMENLGVWDFACRYVAMTAKQCAVCQEKASA